MIVLDGLCKFRFFVLDDKETADGWPRAFEHILRPEGYLGPRLGREKACPERDDGTRCMAYEVLTGAGERGRAHEVGRRLGDSEGETDFWFLDVNLSQNPGFLSDDPSFVERPWEELADGEKSAFDAGLYYLANLPEDDRPKILYSGSTEVQSRLRVIEHIFGNRFQDLLFGDIDDDEYRTRIVDRLNGFLRRRQRSVVRGQKISDLAGARKALNRGDFDTPCLPDVRLAGSWSLRSLFPREINLLDAGIEKYRLEVEWEFDLDWRVLAQRVFSHPNGKPAAYWFPYDTPGAFLQAMRELDFRVEHRTRDTYLPVTTLPHFSTDLSVLDALRRQLALGEEPAYRARWAGISFPLSAKEYLEQHSGEAAANESTWKPRAEALGVSALDVAFLGNVFVRNAEKFGGFDRLHIEEHRTGMAEDLEGLSLVWIYRQAAPESCVAEARATLRTANDRPDWIDNEGLRSACRITCGRYRGRLSVSGCVQAFWDGSVALTEQVGEWEVWAAALAAGRAFVAVRIDRPDVDG